jgi:hypothetical protein
MTDYDDNDDDGLRSIVERIQVGDTDEGMEAVSELLERASAKRGNLEAELDAVVSRRRLRGEIDSALKNFAERNPQITNDPYLADAGMHAVRDQIERDLRGIGVTDEILAPLRGNTDALVQAYGAARMKAPDRVRAPEQLLDAAGQELKSRFGVKSLSKRTPQNVIREMREARGFSNSDEHIPAERGPQTAADEARNNRAREIMEKRRAQYDNIRNGIRSDNADAY